MINQIKKLHQKIELMAIIITDVKNEDTLKCLSEISEGRMYNIEVPGPNLAALTCVVPLQRLAYDLTIALGLNPDRPRNLAKELTTQ